MGITAVILRCRPDGARGGVNGSVDMKGVGSLRVEHFLESGKELI